MNYRAVSCWRKQVSPFKVMTDSTEEGATDVCFLFVVLGKRKETPAWDWLPVTFVHTIFITHYLNHVAVLPPIFHHGHLPVVSSPKVSSLSFSTLVSPATFLPDHVSGPLGISKSTRGHREYCPLKGVSGPKLFYSPGTMTLPSSVYLLIDDCWKHQISLHLLWCPRPVSEFADP